MSCPLGFKSTAGSLVEGCHRAEEGSKISHGVPLTSRIKLTKDKDYVKQLSAMSGKELEQSQLEDKKYTSSSTVDQILDRVLPGVSVFVDFWQFFTMVLSFDPPCWSRAFKDALQIVRDVICLDLYKTLFLSHKTLLRVFWWLTIAFIIALCLVETLPLQKVYTRLGSSGGDSIAVLSAAISGAFLLPTFSWVLVGWRCPRLWDDGTRNEEYVNIFGDVCRSGSTSSPSSDSIISSGLDVMYFGHVIVGSTVACGYASVVIRKTSGKQNCACEAAKREHPSKSANPNFFCMRNAGSSSSFPTYYLLVKILCLVPLVIAHDNYLLWSREVNMVLLAVLMGMMSWLHVYLHPYLNYMADAIIGVSWLLIFLTNVVYVVIVLTGTGGAQNEELWQLVL